VPGFRNIFAWLKKYKLNPVTGKRMSAKDIIVLNMHRNSDGKWCCPVTTDEFNEGSHIVAIRPTGNVFSYEAVRKLNIERKDWKDLSSGEAFERSDIIHLHDPSNLSSKHPKTFYHIVNKLDYRDTETSELEKRIVLNPVTAEIIAAASRTPIATVASSSSSTASSSSLSKSAVPSKPATTSSFTATNVTYAAPAPSSSSSTSSDGKRTNRKGKVQLVTNFGTLELVLHCDQCPKTCENFLLLVERGYYDGVVFHRSIKNFMIQGGDPEGTGKGGQSAWGAPFEDEIVPALKHDGRGVLSMANKGPATNTSQFFILYKSASHLDGKHTVFGKLTQDSMAVLKEMEAVDTDANARPKEPIRIIKAGIIDNPFDEHSLKEERIANAAAAARREQERRERTERGLWYSNPSAALSSTSSAPSSTTSQSVGKYIVTDTNTTSAEDKTSAEKKRSMQSMEAPPPAKRSKPPAAGASSSSGGWAIF